MSCITVDCTTGTEVLDALHNFLIVGHTLNPDFRLCSGNCYIDDAIGTASSVYEQLTITFSSPTEFYVTGTVSGSMGTGTVETLFSHPRVTFTVKMPTLVDDLYSPVACVAGDAITMIMTPGWTAAETGPLQYRYVAPGNDGLQAINIGISSFSDGTGGYHNARVYMFPKWKLNSNGVALAWGSQPNVLYNAVWQMGPASAQARTLYAVADGKFCYVVCKINTVYCAACFGWTDTVHSYDLLPQPMLCGGSYVTSSEPGSTSTSWQWVNCNTAPGLCGIQAFTSDYSGSNPLSSSSLGYPLYAMTPLKTWLGCARISAEDTQTRPWQTKIGTVYPSRCDGSTLVAPNFDGSFPLFRQWLVRQTDNTVTRGSLGGIPFTKLVPTYKYDNSLVNAGTKIRDKASRSRHLFIPVGTSTTAMYALEMI